eukprot:403361805
MNSQQYVHNYKPSLAQGNTYMPQTQCQNLNQHPYYYQQAEKSGKKIISSRKNSQSLEKKKNGQQIHQYYNQQYHVRNAPQNQDFINSNQQSIIDELAQSTLQKELNWVNQQFLNFNPSNDHENIQAYKQGSNGNNQLQILNESFETQVNENLQDYDEDEEFNKIAQIYYSVNLIQRSFRVLKILWSQAKKQRLNSNIPVQLSRVTSKQYIDKENLKGIYDMTFDQVLCNSMSSLLRNRNKQMFSPQLNSQGQLIAQTQSPLKASTSSLYQNAQILPSPDKKIDWNIQDLSQLPQLRFQQNLTTQQSHSSLNNTSIDNTPHLNGQNSVMSFCRPNQDMNHQELITRNDVHFLQLANRNPNNEDFSTAQSMASHINFDGQQNQAKQSQIFQQKRRSSVGSIGGIKDSILEINLILGINKIRSFLEKNDQRQKVSAFFDLNIHAKTVNFNQKIHENDMISRSLANDSIIQTSKLQKAQNEKTSYAQKAMKMSVNRIFKILTKQMLSEGLVELKQNLDQTQLEKELHDKKYKATKHLGRIFIKIQEMTLIKSFQQLKAHTLTQIKAINEFKQRQNTLTFGK